jgi:uncharacterized repeat protein (TIGR02543 family)
MNSVRKVALIPSLFSLFLLVSCGSNSSATSGNTSLPGGESSGGATSGQVATTYTITFNSNGGSAVAPLTVNAGSVASKPADPSKSGYAFAGWFEQDSLVSPFNWSAAVTSDWTLYANWSNGSSSSTSSSSSTTSQPGTSESSETSSAASSSTIIYFKDASWWNDSAAGTAIYLFKDASNELKAWPGTLMTHVTYDTTGKFNIWSFDLGNYSAYPSAVFARTSADGTEFIDAQTVDITLADRGTNNLYDISATSAAWNPSKVTGTWSTYSA